MYCVGTIVNNIAYLEVVRRVDFTASHYKKKTC